MVGSLLEVKDLRSCFFTRRGVVKAVDGVSFSVKEGEALGLVGESGCGKSVTALSILRLLPYPVGQVVEGEILFRGESLLQKSQKEMRKVRGKHISMIVQDPMTSLNPVFTIGNQLNEAIRIHTDYRGTSLLKRAIDLLSNVRIPSPEVRMRNYPHELSGGMRQRVAGAIALACEPHLLICDEPTTSLDVTIQSQYLHLLRELQREHGLAMIFITHDFGIVARVCDRVAVMYAGKIVEKADVRELFNNPVHPYTQALMKSVPKVEEKAESLEAIGGQPPVLYDLPPGCAFAPRCSSIGDKCNPEDFPAETEAGEGHWVSCWLYG